MSLTKFNARLGENILEVVSTIDELRRLKHFDHTVLVLGASEKDDGDGGIYSWDAASTSQNNNLSVVQSYKSNTGRWIRLSDFLSSGTSSGIDGVSFDSSKHTGDGATTQFELGFTAIVETPQAYLVSVDGSLQSPIDSYTIDLNSNQIRFYEAPPTDSIIIVTTTGATGSSLVVSAEDSYLRKLDSSKHTGDGSTTGFNLSFTASVSNPEAYLVSIDGAMQSPIDSYTIDLNSNQIVLSDPPPVNAKIVVVTMGITAGNLTSFDSSTHVGDGSTSIFPLSFTPQTAKPQAYIVAIDGALQSPVNAYEISINPPQITFGGPPPDGSQIVITTTSATSTVVPDEIEVTADGSTTARDLSERFAYTGSPLDFGAVGDGVADDTVAIQAALDAADGVNQHIVDGGGLTYRIHSSLKFKKAYITFQNFQLIADESWDAGTIDYTDMGSAAGGESAAQKTNRGNPMIRVIRDDTGLTGRHFARPKLKDFVLDCNDVAPGLCVVETREGRFENFSIHHQKGYGMAVLVKNTEGAVSRGRIHESFWGEPKQADPTGALYQAAGYVQTCADVYVYGLVAHYSKYPMWIDGYYNSQFVNCHAYNGSYPNPSDLPNIYIGPDCYHTSWSNTYVDNGYIEMHSFSHAFNGGIFTKTAYSSNEYIAKLIAPSGGTTIEKLTIQGFNNATKPVYVDETLGDFTAINHCFIPNGGNFLHSAHDKVRKIDSVVAGDWVADGSYYTYTVDLTNNIAFKNAPFNVQVELVDRRTAAGRAPLQWDYYLDQWDAVEKFNLKIRSNEAAACRLVITINEGYQS